MVVAAVAAGDGAVEADVRRIGQYQEGEQVGRRCGLEGLEGFIMVCLWRLGWICAWPW
jgi:hypothetical protein